MNDPLALLSGGAGLPKPEALDNATRVANDV